ncbi:MAG TPA: ABC transporter ATP-binding protein, partial [Ornithinibacter sp.]|nr:ABC transporter ATP-binding protein [Ornithinibacter sp.]
MSSTAPTSGTRMDTGEDIGAIATLRLGMRYSPELREGLGLTLVYAVIASCGQIVVPIAVQQTLDRGLGATGGPRLDYVAWMGVLAALAIAVTSWASYMMTNRLFTTSERGLATLRTK